MQHSQYWKYVMKLLQLNPKRSYFAHQMHYVAYPSASKKREISNMIYKCHFFVEHIPCSAKCRWCYRHCQWCCSRQRPTKRSSTMNVKWVSTMVCMGGQRTETSVSVWWHGEGVGRVTEWHGRRKRGVQWRGLFWKVGSGRGQWCWNSAGHSSLGGI
jgi:hypothetical protein